ncbi:unnamed protein product, partial [Protopolystoma xenopodis]
MPSLLSSSKAIGLESDSAVIGQIFARLLEYLDELHADSSSHSQRALSRLYLPISQLIYAVIDTAAAAMASLHESQPTEHGSCTIRGTNNLLLGSIPTASSSSILSDQLVIGLPRAALVYLGCLPPLGDFDLNPPTATICDLPQSLGNLRAEMYHHLFRPGPHVFSLLATYLLRQSRDIHTPGQSHSFGADEPVTIWWQHFLSRLTTDSSDSYLRGDQQVSHRVVQLLCLLAGQPYGLTGKKSLLHCLIANLPSALDVEARGKILNLQKCCLMLVLLRYQLHHLYDPPGHLADQLRPFLGLLGRSSATTDEVWQFSRLKIRASRFSSWFTVHRPEYFYDLLL